MSFLLCLSLPSPRLLVITRNGGLCPPVVIIHEWDRFFKNVIEVDAPIAGRTPRRSVREFLNHIAFRPVLVIRVMYWQDKIYQDPCTGRAKNYQDCEQPKQSIIRVMYR